MNDSEFAKLVDQAQAGERADQFINSNFWKKDLEPMFVRIQNDSRERSLPGEDEILTAEQIGIRSARLGGRYDAIGEICKEISRMSRDGREAQKKLDAARPKAPPQEAVK